MSQNKLSEIISCKLFIFAVKSIIFFAIKGSKIAIQVIVRVVTKKT